VTLQSFLCRTRWPDWNKRFKENYDLRFITELSSDGGRNTNAVRLMTASAVTRLNEGAPISGKNPRATSHTRNLSCRSWFCRNTTRVSPGRLNRDVEFPTCLIHATAPELTVNSQSYRNFLHTNDAPKA
jgi:hypothetical protein